MFRALTRLSRDEVDAWLDAHDDANDGTHDDAPVGVTDLHASVDRAAFTQAIDAIHRAIRDGETYQVNFTYRLDGAAFGTPLALYRKLRARQPVAYGAYIVLPEDSSAGAATHVLSLSPELFLRHDGGRLTARPMKGTAARVAAPESDSESARLLAIDIKNRAENLMIVDLLRNDLGRLAQIGSVRVPALFAIEPYATVFQMTSTVQAQIRAEVGMPELLRAVFPCGSITGAPKHHTMELIAQLEGTPRGVYCGAIGYIGFNGRTDLNIAIRTAQFSGGIARVQGGGGITARSQPPAEYEESLTKIRRIMEAFAA
jgi:para-aminobenzoate synthetase/4-amino-4-deoxychorismate lyase